ncbi:MAG: RidA family protein [Lachnospiraceae bacterium]|nr:RidA family protein [Lachnospiraceae bacterium]
MGRIEEKMKELGYVLPQAPKPVAAYVPGVQDGCLVYTSGQLPTENGVLHKGKLGENMTIEEGYEAARLSALNCLGVLKSMVGDLDRVERIVKVVGFVNSTPDFESQPKVVNGASELLGEIFGDAGKHARSAVGVNSLPLGAACEIEIVAHVR